MSAPQANRRRFRFQQTLGKGGFGEVYLAEMTAPSGLSSQVAVKVLHAGLDPRSQAVQRLKDEARILSMLNHPAIVGVHDLALLEGRIAMVTEFVEGADLPECTTGPDPMPRGAVLEAWAQVAGALDAAHHATDAQGVPLGLLHRDVKPRNVRVGKHGQVKLLDFGIATGTGFERDANTQTGALIGSFPYIPPERFKRAPATPAGDLYSLGCSIAESLTGEMLFQADDVASFVAMKASREEHDRVVADLLTALPDDPPGLRALLGELLSFDPAGRPPAPAVIARLEDLASDAGGPRLSRWSRGRVWPEPASLGESGPLSGQVITEAAGLTAVDTQIVDLQEPEPAPEPARPPRVESTPTSRDEAPSRRTGLWLGGALASAGFAALALAGVLAVGLGAWALYRVGDDRDDPDGTASVDAQTSEPRPAPPVPETAPATPDTPPAPAIVEPARPRVDPAPVPSATGDPARPRPVEPAPEPLDARSGPLSADGCGASETLEGAAAEGALTPDARACLGAAMRDRTALQTARQRAGRMVLVDALKRCEAGSCADYEREQAYYFAELGESDATMMLRWAKHLGATGRPADARRWAARALERRDQWRGLEHTRNVEQLYRLDALSANALWEQAPTDEARRREVREAALTWADYRRQLTRDPREAIELCAAATGDREACERRLPDPGTGIEVTIASEPGGAEVLLLGVPIGRTPLKRTLSTGRHTLEVRTADGSVSREFEVGVGKPTRWTLNVATGEWALGL